MRGQEGKYLLKKAMEPHLPHEIMYRPKMGFAVPLERWFRGPLRQRLTDAHPRSQARRHRRVQPALPEAAWSTPTVAGTRDYSAPLWTLLMFDAFLRNVMQDDALTSEKAAG